MYREEPRNPYRSVSASELSRRSSRQSRAPQSPSNFSCSFSAALLALEMPAAARNEVPELYAPAKAYHYSPSKSSPLAATSPPSKCRSGGILKQSSEKPRSRTLPAGDLGILARELHSTVFEAAPELRAVLEGENALSSSASSGASPAVSPARRSMPSPAAWLGETLKVGSQEHLQESPARPRQSMPASSRCEGEVTELLQRSPARRATVPARLQTTLLAQAQTRASLALPEPDAEASLCSSAPARRPELDEVPEPILEETNEAPEDRRCSCGFLVDPTHNFCGKCGTRYVRPQRDLDDLVELSWDRGALSDGVPEDEEGFGKQLRRFEARVLDFRKRQETTRQRMAPLLRPGPSERFVKAMANAREQMVAITRSAEEDFQCLAELEAETQDLHLQAVDLEDTDERLRDLLRRMSDKMDHMRESM